MSTEEGSCATVTGTVVLSEPEVTVIVAVPFATAVATPAVVTEATPGLSLSQSKACPDIGSPF